MPKIKGPDGRVVLFPDGTSDEVIARAFKPQSANQPQQAATPAPSVASPQAQTPPVNSSGWGFHPENLKELVPSWSDVKSAVTHPLDYLLGGGPGGVGMSPSHTQVEEDKLLQDAAAQGSDVAKTALGLTKITKSPLIHPSSSKRFQSVLDPQSKNPLSRGATGAVKLLEGLTSPENLALLASLPAVPEGLGKLIGGAFSVDMGKESAVKAVDTAKALSEARYGDAAESGITSLGSLGFAYGAGKHALGDRVVTPTTAESVTPVEAQTAQSTSVDPTATAPMTPAAVAGKSRLDSVLGKRPVQAVDSESGRVSTVATDAVAPNPPSAPANAIVEAPAASEVEANAATTGYGNFVGDVIKKNAAENAGQAILDGMDEAGESPYTVHSKFWKDTYWKLPADRQQAFQNMLSKQWGSVNPGDVIGMGVDRQPIRAKDWQHIASLTDIPDEVSNLQGTERGYIALMKQANDGVGHLEEGTGAVAATPVKQVEGLGPGEIQPKDAVPAPDVSSHEARIRPLVGQLLRLKQLQVGEKASHSIDEAIQESNTVEGKIPDNHRKVVSALLGEEVGETLTPAQHTKLEKLRGAAESTSGPKPLWYGNEFIAKNRWRNEFDSAIDESNRNITEALNDPHTDPATKEMLETSLAKAQKGKGFFLYKKLKHSYPDAVDLPVDHPEAPFASKAYGNPITSYNLKNLEVAVGKQPRDLFLGRRDQLLDGKEVKSLESLDALRKGEVDPHAPKEEVPVPEAQIKTAVPAGRNGLGSLQDRILTDEQAAIAAEKLGIPFAEAKGRSLGDLMARNAQALTPTSSSEVSGDASVREISGSETNMEAGAQTEKADLSGPAREFEQKSRELKQVALGRLILKTEKVLKGFAGDWQKQRGEVPTELTEQLSRLPESTRKLLPKELYADKTKRSRSTANVKSETARIKQSVSSTRGTEATSAILGSGTKGKAAYTSLVKIRKDFPEAVADVEMISDAITKRYPSPEVRLKTLTNALETFHSALKNNDTFALKKAVDSVMRTGEQGAVGLNVSEYTPEQAREIAASAVDRYLSRYEKMSDIQLKMYRESLWSEVMSKTLDESAPVDLNDGGQTELHQSLKDRYNELTRRAGPSVSATLNLDQAFKRAGDTAEYRANTKQIIRSTAGPKFRDLSILKNQYNLADKVMDSMSEADRINFMDKMERGDFENMSSDSPGMARQWFQNKELPPLRDIAQILRAGLDNAREDVNRASGDLGHFIQNYVPHMYDNVGKAQAFAAAWWEQKKNQGSGSLEGTTSFLKEREHEFFADALAVGLQPKTTNPIRLSLMRIEQMKRYAMAHEMFNKFTEDPSATGATFIKSGEAVPENYTKFNDRIFDKKSAGQGAWYAPKDVTRIFNNFVSEGLRGKWTLPYTNFSMYDAVRGSGNIANAFQLSLSAFHAVETGIDSMFTSMGVGIQKMWNQKDMSGLLDVVKAPIAPFENIYHGSHVIANFENPTKFLDYADVSEAIERSNGRIEVDPEFRIHQFERFKDNWKAATSEYRHPSDRVVHGFKAANNLIGSTLQALSYPIMQWWVPRIKMGAFMKEARQTLSEYEGQPQNIIDQQLQKKWDSIDNRFGEVVYDNLFIHKTLQDIMGATMRSPGWNIGTVREGLGAVKGLSMLKEGKISHQTAYIMSMTAAVMMMSAVYTKMHTGNNPEGMDYFFPRDGSADAEGHENRVFIKTYLNDYISMYHAPLDTAYHKASPIVSTLSDIVRNKNFYGREIRDPGDNKAKQLAAVLGFMAGTTVKPFTVQNMEESNLRGSKNSLASAFAIMPAPSWTMKSNAENLANTYFQEQSPQGAMAPERLEKKGNFLKLRSAYQQGKLSDDDLQKAMEEGKLDPKMLGYLLQTQGKPALVRNVEQLKDWSHIRNVWKVADDEEKQKLLPTMLSKSMTMIDGKEQEEFLNELQQYLDKTQAH